jgi:hypothetical protein
LQENGWNLIMSDEENKIINLFSVVNDNSEREIDRSVEEAFSKALEQDIRDVMILGWTKDDQLFMSLAVNDAPDMIFMLELVKKEILDAARS